MPSASGVPTWLSPCWRSANWNTWEITALHDLLLTRGVKWQHLPVRNQDIPDRCLEESWRESGQPVRTILAQGGNVLLHCRRDMGRTGVIAARLLVEFGFKPLHALELIRMACPGAMETTARREYVLQLRKWPNFCKRPEREQIVHG